MSEENGELKDSIALFKFLRLFDPRMVQSLNITAEDRHQDTLQVVDVRRAS